jgi:flagellar protein FliS
MNVPMKGLARYGAVKVTTCSPGQLLIMLYDALFRFLREATDAMTAKDHAKAGERMGRSLAILDQLLRGLDRSVLPSLCDKLEPLYMFCMSHITQASSNQEPARLAEVIRILTPLREAWGVAVAQVAPGGTPESAPKQVQQAG